MKRRTFLAASSAAALVPAAAFADFGIAYKPGLVEAALKEGKTVLVDFAADWCSTCKRQERVINALRSENPSYDANMIFVRVDWDDYGRHEFTTSRNVPRRSTLILLKGDQELGRIVAGTDKRQIKELLDLGVSANS